MCGHLTLAAFEPGETVAALAQWGVLHAECARIFRRDKDENGLGPSIRLHHQQQEAIAAAGRGGSYRAARPLVPSSPTRGPVPE